MIKSVGMKALEIQSQMERLWGTPKEVSHREASLLCEEFGTVRNKFQGKENGMPLRRLDVAVYIAKNS